MRPDVPRDGIEHLDRGERGLTLAGIASYQNNAAISESGRRVAITRTSEIWAPNHGRPVARHYEGLGSCHRATVGDATSSHQDVATQQHGCRVGSPSRQSIKRHPWRRRGCRCKRIKPTRRANCGRSRSSSRRCRGRFTITCATKDKHKAQQRSNDTRFPHQSTIHSRHLKRPPDSGITVSSRKHSASVRPLRPRRGAAHRGRYGAL